MNEDFSVLCSFSYAQIMMRLKSHQTIRNCGSAVLSSREQFANTKQTRIISTGHRIDVVQSENYFKKGYTFNKLDHLQLMKEAHRDVFIFDTELIFIYNYIHRRSYHQSQFNVGKSLSDSYTAPDSHLDAEFRPYLSSMCARFLCTFRPT